MSKKTILAMTLLIICVLFSCGKTDKVQAATDLTSVHAGDWVSKEEVRTVGGTKFRLEDVGGFFGSQKRLYAIKNNRKWLLATSDGIKDNLSNRILTDGKTVYYVKRIYTKSLDGRSKLTKRIKIYRVKIGHKSKELYSIKPKTNDFNADFGMLGIYGGKIIFVNWDDVYSYTIKSKKYEKLNVDTSDGKVRQYKNYIYIWNSPWVNVGNLQIFNAKSKKVVATIGDVVGSSEESGLERNGMYDIVSGKLYYLEVIGKRKYNSYAGFYNYVSLKKCNLNGSGKTTLVKKIAVAQAKQVVFKKHSITYYNASGKKRTKKF